MEAQYTVTLVRGTKWYMWLKYLHPIEGTDTSVFSYKSITEDEFNDMYFVKKHTIEIIPEWFTVEVGLINEFPKREGEISSCTRRAVAVALDNIIGLGDGDGEEWKHWKKTGQLLK